MKLTSRGFFVLVVIPVLALFTYFNVTIPPEPEVVHHFIPCSPVFEQP